jgi:heat shock protein HslJ
MGEYHITEQGEMKFLNVASTRRMCREAELESQFLTILGRTTHYEIDGDMLMLLSNGEVQIILQAK